MSQLFYWLVVALAHKRWQNNLCSVQLATKRNYIIHVACRINDVIEECWLNVPTLAKIFTLAPDLAICLLYTSYQEHIL